MIYLGRLLKYNKANIGSTMLRVGRFL